MMRRGNSLLILLLTLSVAAPLAAKKPVCGNDNMDRGEQCDGSDLGGQTCLDFGYATGSLSCAADCTLDTSACVSLPQGYCGDGLVGEHEECDGSDDADCAGRCSSQCACPSLAASGFLEVHLIDVGQGDAILVVSPDGFTLLVDAGEENKAATVESYLAAMGVTELDYTLASHMHSDHIGGLDVVLASHPEVVASFDHGGFYSSNEFDEYDAAVGLRRTMVEAGQSLDLGPDLLVEVLHGDAGSVTENNNSVVIRLTHGSTAVLLGGDCESACEGRFDPGPVDVYKVHHHGSDTASSDALLSQMNPDLALISVGYGNSYNHPDDATLARLASHGASVYRTDLGGDLLLRSDGLSYVLEGTSLCSEGASRDCGSSDVGQCQLGTQSCSGGAWEPCVGAVEASDEICDSGLDEDCDGLSDDADPDCGGSAAHVLLVQVAYDTPGTDSLEEFVDLYNPTDAEVDLAGWRLADPVGSWALPAGTVIAAGSYLSVAADAAGFEALHGTSPDVSGLSIALNNTGDALDLRDPSGTVIDHLAWESYETGWTVSAATGDSVVRSDPALDSDTAADWQVLSPASPLGGGGSTPPPPADPCGDGVCAAGEDCLSCAADCIGKTGGKPSGRYCCGNGSCEAAGEDALSCTIDCG